MNTADFIKNAVLLDRQTKVQSELKIQKSIRKAVDEENYEWQTIRVEKTETLKLNSHFENSRFSFGIGVGIHI